MGQSLRMLASLLKALTYNCKWTHAAVACDKTVSGIPRPPGQCYHCVSCEDCRLSLKPPNTSSWGTVLNLELPSLRELTVVMD